MLSSIKDYLKKNNHKIDIDTIAELLSEAGLDTADANNEHEFDEILEDLASHGAIISGYNDDAEGIEGADYINNYIPTVAYKKVIKRIEEDYKDKNNIDQDTLYKLCRSAVSSSVGLGELSDEMIDDIAKDVFLKVYDDKDKNMNEETYDKNDAYENALQDAYENLDLYLLEIIKDDDKGQYILDSDFDATVAGVIDDVFGEEEYKELQDDTDTYYKIFDKLVEHGIDTADKYGVPIIEDDDLKNKAPKDKSPKEDERVIINEYDRGTPAEIELIANDAFYNKIKPLQDSKKDMSDDDLIDLVKDLAKKYSIKYVAEDKYDKIYDAIMDKAINNNYDDLIHDTSDEEKANTFAQMIQDGVDAAKDKVFKASNGMNYLAAEDFDDVLKEKNGVDGYDEEYLNAVLKKLNAQITDRTHPDYPYKDSSVNEKVDIDALQEESMNDTLDQQEKFKKAGHPALKNTIVDKKNKRIITDHVNDFSNDLYDNAALAYLEKYHPDMNYAQWRTKIANNELPGEIAKYNNWLAEEGNDLFHDYAFARDDYPDKTFDRDKDFTIRTEEFANKHGALDDNGHKDYYSDRTLKNIINTLNGRLL